MKRGMFDPMGLFKESQRMNTGLKIDSQRTLQESTSTHWLILRLSLQITNLYRIFGL